MMGGHGHAPWRGSTPSARGRPVFSSATTWYRNLPLSFSIVPVLMLSCSTPCAKAGLSFWHVGVSRGARPRPPPSCEVGAAYGLLRALSSTPFLPVAVPPPSAP